MHVDKNHCHQTSDTKIAFLKKIEFSNHQFNKLIIAAKIGRKYLSSIYMRNTHF